MAESQMICAQNMIFRWIFAKLFNKLDSFNVLCLFDFLRNWCWITRPRKELGLLMGMIMWMQRLASNLVENLAIKFIETSPFSTNTYHYQSWGWACNECRFFCGVASRPPFACWFFASFSCWIDDIFHNIWWYREKICEIHLAVISKRL